MTNYCMMELRHCTKYRFMFLSLKFKASYFWRFCSSGTWCCIIGYSDPNILKGCTAFIFKGQYVHLGPSYRNSLESSATPLKKPQYSHFPSTYFINWKTHFSASHNTKSSPVTCHIFPLIIIYNKHNLFSTLLVNLAFPDTLLKWLYLPSSGYEASHCTRKEVISFGIQWLRQSLYKGP